MDRQFLDKLKKIKVLALDCDGVMTPLHIDTGVIMDLENAMKYHDRKFQLHNNTRINMKRSHSTITTKRQNL